MTSRLRNFFNRFFLSNRRGFVNGDGFVGPGASGCENTDESKEGHYPPDIVFQLAGIPSRNFSEAYQVFQSFELESFISGTLRGFRVRLHYGGASSSVGRAADF